MLLTHCNTFQLLVQVRTTRAGIMDYFSNFLQLAPQGKVDQSTIRLLPPTLVTNTLLHFKLPCRCAPRALASWTTFQTS
jgi:hypothetical protein